MQKSYCIICGNERDGIEIKGDNAIKTIRWFKRNVTRNEKDNRLVVCRECYPKYEKARKKYESRRITYAALGVLFAALSLIISPRPATLVIAVLVVAFLYALSYLTYMPALSIRIEKHPKAQKKQQI